MVFEVKLLKYIAYFSLRESAPTSLRPAELQEFPKSKYEVFHPQLASSYILDNHKTEIPGKGMPIGNLTSQFFANVYLNELDRYVKNVLKAKYYLRYVDDFVIFHRDRKILEKWKNEISMFLAAELKVNLHPEKSGIIMLDRGITLLGFRIFHHSRLVKKSSARRIWKRLEKLKKDHDKGKLTKEQADAKLLGWITFASFANTYKPRRRVQQRYNQLFSE